MQALRRSVQIAVLLLLILIPFFNFYGIKIQQKDYHTIEESASLSAIHALFEDADRDDVIGFAHRVKGSVWAADIAGFKISDPLAVLESTTTAFYFYTPLFLSVLVPVVLTVILGRVYCGWICPMNLILELNDKLRGLLKKTGYQARDIKFSRKTKYGILIGGLILAFIAGMPLLSLIYPPAIISRELFYKVYNGAWGNGLLIIAGICFFELILSRRWWCRYVCPGGAIYVALSAFRPLKIKRDDAACDQCGKCIPVCPYDLKPMVKSLTAECDQCGQCISVCAPGALKYTLQIVPVKG